MLLTIPNVLTKDEVARSRDLLDRADWIDGKVTAGYQAARAKNNQQVPEDHPAAKDVGEIILRALGRSPLFISAALPKTVFPPLFNKYQGGQAFGTHVDNAIRLITGTPLRIRTDVSMTVFLTDPSEYDGGELVVEDTYGVHKIKLAAGDMVLYPATSLHHVTPVTRGARVSSFFWVQSLVRDDGQRAILYDLDLAIQRVGRDHPDSPLGVQLNGVYQNLLRQWSDL